MSVLELEQDLEFEPVETDSIKPLSALTSHINDMHKYEYGDEHDQLELAKRASSGDKQAREQLIINNWRLSWYLARRYQGMGVDMADLVQWGHVGLCEAVDRFDYTKGFRFSTYAMWWIRHYIKRAIEDHGRIIRVPTWVAEHARVLEELVDQYRLAHDGKKPSLEEMAKALQMDKGSLLAFLNGQPYSTEDLPPSAGEDTNYEEAVSDEDSGEEHRRELCGFLLEWPIERLKAAWTSLPLRHRHVLERRHGFAFRGNSPKAGPYMTLEEIGKEMGFSRERARQIEKEAMGLIHAWIARNEPTLGEQMKRVLQAQAVTA